eukprot:6187562-Pleurochrysis_carterae.AAC.2
MDVFQRTYGRAPVLYDFFCGHGMITQAAALAGCRVVGFDGLPPSRHFGNLPGSRQWSIGRTQMPNVTHEQVDLDDASFWSGLMSKLHAEGQPPPDIMHASLPCAAHSKLANLPRMKAPEASLVEATIKRFSDYQKVRSARTHVYVPWSVENVSGAAALLRGAAPHVVRLCGTMLGHRVFRHRLLALSDAWTDVPACQHQGKTLGTRGVRDMKTSDYVESNMFAPYSRYQAEKRGSLNELHDAISFADRSFSYTGLIQGLPSAMGNLLLLIRYHDARAKPELAEVLQRWARKGYVDWTRRALELGAPPTQIVELAEPDAASLVQKASRARRADDAVHRPQKFFRSKIAVPRSRETYAPPHA